MDHILRILTEYVLSERRPSVSMLWLSEPDVSQHAHGVGSPEAVQAIRDADRHFGRLLAWLEERGLSSDTDVIIVSDHGYSTISEVIDVEAELRERRVSHRETEPGGVAVAPNGGSALFYAPPDTTERLAEWLTTQPWCGALVASEATGDVPGTLSAALIGLEGPRVPKHRPCLSVVTPLPTPPDSRATPTRPTSAPAAGSTAP